MFEGIVPQWSGNMSLLAGIVINLQGFDIRLKRNRNAPFWMKCPL